MSRSRLFGVVLTASMLIGGWLFYFSTAAPARREAPVARRGGQLVGSSRADPRSFNRLHELGLVTYCGGICTSQIYTTLR